MDDSSQCKNAPHFLDGEPTNLEAAALDALEWLDFLDIIMHDGRYFRSGQWSRNSLRLQEAIKSLRKFLPDSEPVFERTPAPSAYGAVAEVFNE